MIVSSMSAWSFTSMTTVLPTDGPKILIYTAELCGYCAAARRLLSQKGVAFEDIDVTGRSEERETLAIKAGGRTSVPQIWIGNLHVGGCDDLFALERAGKLDPLLVGATPA
jgi:glutaredoxin 3